MRPLLLASGGPRRIARPASILSLTLGLLLSACASNRNVSQTTPQQEPPAQSSPSEITAEPTTPQQPTATEPSIGEQLGRLDALMRTATGDSLARLREEYDRLLQRANGGIIQTGGTSQTTMAEPAQPEGATPQLKGLRPSELRFADGEGTATPATPATPRRPTSRPEQAKATTRATDRSDEVEIPREPSKNATLAQRQKKLVDGLAATRAGDYQKATQDLPKALSTPVNGARRL